MALSRFSIRSPNHSSSIHWVLVSISVIPLDYLTGPYLDSMVLLYPIQRRWPPGTDRAGGASPLRRPSRRYACSFSTLWGWGAPALEAVLDTTVIVLFSIAIAHIILHLRRQALTLRVLGGMLPICGFCKRIRTGESWAPLERFISNHSEAQFSHTFCSECGSKHHGDYLAP